MYIDHPVQMFEVDVSGWRTSCSLGSGRYVACISLRCDVAELNAAKMPGWSQSKWEEDKL